MTDHHWRNDENTWCGLTPKTAGERPERAERTTCERCLDVLAQHHETCARETRRALRRLRAECESP